MDYEKMYEDVYEHLSADICEAVELAKMFDYDWNTPYDGVDDLFHGYFGGDLVEIIEAFTESDITPDNCETYYVDENGFNVRLYTSWDVEDLVENHIDDVASSIIHEVENGNLCFLRDEISEELFEIVNPAPDIDALLTTCKECVTSAHSLLIRAVNEGFGDLPKWARRYAWSVDLFCYLKGTKLCGLPEELYDKIDCCGLIEHIVTEYDDYGKCWGLSIEKFAEVNIQSYFKLGVYR